MAEKRKPDMVLLLRKPGKKTNKVELFNGRQWPDRVTYRDHLRRPKYRLRVNGKWWPEGEMQFFTKTEFMRIFAKSILR